MPFCNASLPIDDRIADMISRISLQEKIGLMDQGGVPLLGLGLNAYRWWEEATHGISPPRNSGKTPYETNFAFPITIAMSFNRSLWRATAQQIAREARAFANSGDEYSTFWTPVVNLAREPRWGRNIETPGEDPYLSGEYATHFVKGFQEAPEDPGHVLASACCKHYVANEMEADKVAGAYWTRHNFNANISMQDLVDSYMLPFQACVEKGQVTSLMCSYNAINGVPACANDWLLQTVARDSWGFDGAIVSDCDADRDVWELHHYTNTPEEGAQRVLRAGTDVDCGGYVTSVAMSAIRMGLLTEADLDRRLYYQFRLRVRLGHFDPPGPLDSIGPEEVCTASAKQLMRDGAAQGATLLKNERRTLPLLASELRSVAVLGPTGNLSEAIAAYYAGGRPCDMKFWTLADAVREQVPQVMQVLGVPDVKGSDEPDPQALIAAKEADAVVLGLGTDLTLAKEDIDPTSLELSEGQRQLVRQVAEVAKGPVVVVLLSAVPLDISELLSNPQVGAVLWAGQPSVAVVGLGAVLFGQKPPAGRMVQTLYPASYADQISIFDFHMRPGPSEWPRPDCVPPGGDWKKCPLGTNPGRTYRFYTGQPVVPFGFGLSYTRFSYGIAAAPRQSISLDRVRDALASAPDGGRFFSASAAAAAGDGLRLAGFAVNVTNVGDVDSDEVVLGFIRPPGAGDGGVPLQSLFGFERVHVKVGQTATVWLYPSAADFTQVDDQGERRALAGDYEVRFGVEADGVAFAKAALTATLPEAPILYT